MRNADIMLKQAQIEAALEHFRSERQPGGTGLPREVREILDHIHRNLFESDLNVQTIKSRCRIRDNNISCRFRYEMGVTIKDYIESLRMEAARLLLERGCLGIFDVAQSVGYYHLQTFYRAFHRQFECTPAAYCSKGRSVPQDGGGPVATQMHHQEPSGWSRQSMAVQLEGIAPAG